MNRANVIEPEEDEDRDEEDEDPKKGKPNPLKIWAKALMAKLAGPLVGE